MAGIVSYTLRDFGGELSSASFPLVAINALSLATVNTQIATLQTAVDGVTSGQIIGRSLSQIAKFDNPAAGALAFRELKWLVTYESDGKRYQLEIPCANTNFLTAGNPSKSANLTAQEWIDFIAAFEAVATGPDGSSPVNFLGARLVGRNL